MAQRIF